ncbi:hypothetical protein CPJCM30710_03930 [Clostridium polyendosporum]|uniref:Uncharacterized protein n=1 Tax=Clostridium polyendosporum TaxID=69208 RepID=A0A919RWT7_9CLOT|nr:hypothetical protein [Clostridium polyendosporum]GIM27727.1 hypothetical protein CPJCM30710_03930 [Clostridium polyendosporum]
MEALAIFGLLVFVFILIGIVFYIIFAYAFYKMAMDAGLENPWMAWIPILQLYILGKLIKSLKIGSYEIPNIELVLPAASLLVIVLNKTPIIGSLLSLANYILMLFALNKIYKMYKPDQATLFTVLSIFGLPIPFIFMSIKDLKPIED